MKNLKIEFSVLVSMMPDEELMSFGLSELDVDCFSSQESKSIFLAIKELHSQKRQATIENTNFPIEIYSNSMQDGILELREFKIACDELLNFKACRELMSMSDMVKSIASGGNFKRALEYCTTSIGRIKSSNDNLSFVTWSTAAKQAKERIIAMQEEGPSKFFISSGYSEIDKIYMGFPRGLVIIAADSGEGKSTVMLPTILSNKDREIFVASTEVTPAGIAANLVAVKSGLFRSDIHRGKIYNESLQHYFDMLDQCVEILKGGVTMQRRLTRIISEMKLWRANTDINEIGIAVIDFLTDVFDEHGNTYSDDRLMRNAISILKGCAMELNLCMIVLCQFNKLRVKEKDKRPKRDYIYGSGAVYQSADVVMYPYRPVMWLPEKEKEYYDGNRYEDCFFIIDKYKESGTKDIPMIFDAYSTQFMCLKKKAVQTLHGEQLINMTADRLNTEWQISLNSSKK